MQPCVIMWFRRDLRLSDNTALFYALQRAAELGVQLIPLFIFDREILDKLSDKRDRRVEFIHHALQEMHTELAAQGSSMLVRYGFPQEIWQSLTEEFDVKHVFANHDYEHYATERDDAIRSLLASYGAGCSTFKDHVIFEKREILTADDRPYTVFTPYSKKWKAMRTEISTQEYSISELRSGFWRTEATQYPLPTLPEMGFSPLGEAFPAKNVREDIISTYNATRDFPAQHGTTRLSVHLRFGTVSVRECVRAALRLNETWLNELIWRDFYMQILWNFPHVAESAFKPAYNAIPWRTSEKDFWQWCEGKTGYPIVDAGMRELNATGYMHNRVRMITASFLTKHLLLDWRWGEKYFAQKLLDFDLAANNGGWQWAAGTGCDAAPYFRIFNPATQTEKFDPKHEYIKRWVPEYGTDAYTEPIIEHKIARERALATYKTALKGAAAENS
ncbi:MAG: deoxyribodipyrimidine photo-lyase [Candidatus Kapaibacterium sp.]|nr:MAG: deoxyribodipyrimidine photo-lyase [Candidatus Kapabacteria bacterium]